MVIRGLFYITFVVFYLPVLSLKSKKITKKLNNEQLIFVLSDWHGLNVYFSMKNNSKLHIAVSKAVNVTTFKVIWDNYL